MTEPTRPLTGAEYLESIRDDREIYLYGERVADVTEHPAFRNPARMTARLYDALHDPEYRDVLTTATDAGGPGGYTHRFFTTPHSADDLVADQQAVAAWSRLTYGWMGRSPDYKASLLGTLGVNADFYNPFADNARRWYRESQEKVLYWNHAIVHPPVDRHRPPDQVGDVFVHVEQETDSGLIVSGAKVVATNSPLTHYNFVAHTGLPIKDRKFAIVATVPMNSAGLKLICRQSYCAAAALTGSPFDYPLSSRLDENDSILVLDKVLIPWENVFIYGDVAKVGMFTGHSGFVERAMFHGCTRLAVKLEFMAGLLAKALDITGAGDFHGVQTRLGEVLAWRNLFWGLSDAAARNPVPWRDNAVLPNPDYCMAYRWFSQVGYARIREIVLQDVASGLIYLPSSAEDFRNDDIRPYLETYLRGSHGVDAVDRAKVMKLLWDAVGTEFGGRHELYERNYSGNHENTRIELLRGQLGDGKMDGYREFVDRCLAEYDLDGWQVPDLVPFRFSHFRPTRIWSFTMGQSKILGESAGQYPLTSRQRDPDHIARTPEHVVAIAFRIKGELSPECLKGALGDVVERHESLRTQVNYSETDGNLGFQEVLPPLPVPLAVHDIPVIPGRSRDEMASDLLAKLNDEGLSFSVTPSLRASLHRFDDHDAVLTLITHHLYSDGWSSDILRREIAACYRARVTGIPHALPTPVPYREFAAWEQEFLQGERAAVARRFWMDKLAGAELCIMPADRLHGPDTLMPRCAVGNFSIDPGNLAKVTASAAQSRCSVWHVSLAAFMVLAEKVSGRSDITLLTVSSGRPTRDFYDTIGLFADLVPVRLEFGNCQSFLELMLLARKASADAIQNQIPFGMILEMFPDLLKSVEDPRGLVPGINYFRSPVAQDDAKSAISVEKVSLPEGLPGWFLRGAFKWNFRVVPPGAFRCVVEYEPDAVDASTIDRWGSDFIGLILAIADRPDQAWKNSGGLLC